MAAPPPPASPPAADALGAEVLVPGGAEAAHPWLGELAWDAQEARAARRSAPRRVVRRALRALWLLRPACVPHGAGARPAGRHPLVVGAPNTRATAARAAVRGSPRRAVGPAGRRACRGGHGGRRRRRSDADPTATAARRGAPAGQARRQAQGRRQAGWRRRRERGSLPGAREALTIETPWHEEDDGRTTSARRARHVRVGRTRGRPAPGQGLRCSPHARLNRRTAALRPRSSPTFDPGRLLQRGSGRRPRPAVQPALQAVQRLPARRRGAPPHADRAARRYFAS